MSSTFKHLFVAQIVVAVLAVCLVLAGLGQDFVAPGLVFFPTVLFAAFSFRLPFSRAALLSYAGVMTAIGAVVLFGFFTGDTGVWLKPANWVFVANVGVAFAALLHLLHLRASN